MKKKLFFILIFLANIFFACAQRTTVEDTVLSLARKDYLESLYLKCSASYIRFYDTQSNSGELEIVRDYIPYNYHVVSSTNLAYELRESMNESKRIVVVYFIHIKEEEALLFEKNTGQGTIDLRVVPTTYFWNLKGNVLVFTLVEETITDFIKNCLPLD